MSEKKEILALIAQLEAGVNAAPLCQGAAEVIRRLLEENEGQATVINNLVDDFLSYATDGVVNPAPYCINRREECCVRPGWCAPGSSACRGFYPAAAPRRE